MKVYTIGFTQKSAQRFFHLLRRADVKRVVDVRLNNSGQLADQGCLLCSEHKPHHCHRRLVAEYLAQKWGQLDTQHLI